MPATRRSLLAGALSGVVGGLAGCSSLIGATDGVLAAVDLATGEEQWTFQTDDWIRSSPAVDGDRVFVGSD